MTMLHIEHAIPNFESWKKAFDSEPVSRERSGVRRYQITQPVDDPNYVMIDLEFDTLREAEAFLAAMQQVWRRVQGTIMWDPKTRISDVMETKEY